MTTVNRIQEAVARLIEGLGQGDTDSMDELFALVYDELKMLAHRQRRRWRGDHTLNTTALVHEVYVKLVAQETVHATGRAHFRALASRAMRHVLCNYARDRRADKRGGGAERRSLEDRDAARGAVADTTSDDMLLDLDTALRDLEAAHPRAARVVECRFFGGLSVEETAAAVEASPRSVKRDWAMAQAWLYRRLEADS